MLTFFLDRFRIQSQYIPLPSKRRSGKTISKVRFLVAHDTGNPNSSAKANVRYYINSKNEQSASAHIFVDDKEIIECVPALTGRPEKAWHVLYSVPKDNELYGVNANDAAIGVEYCYGKNINSHEAYERYVWVLAKLCHVFELDPLKDIIGHHLLDPKRKTDPVSGLKHSNRTYHQLLNDVALELHRCQVQEDPLKASGEAKVSVRLRMREQPNTHSLVKGVVDMNTVVRYQSIIRDGESVNGNAVWYQLENGWFVWSGALLFTETS